jgi:hypothetical protein
MPVGFSSTSRYGSRSVKWRPKKVADLERTIEIWFTPQIRGITMDNPHFFLKKKNDHQISPG